MKNPFKKIDFVTIPKGTFVMGSPEHKVGRFSDEKLHKVTLVEDFEMQKTQVTQKQYQTIMGTNPSEFKGLTNPVENVSWDDTQDFIKKLNDLDKKFTYRLPTEAEWEYAARAGTNTLYSFKVEDLNKRAWYYGNSNGTTHPVGKLKANRFGLHDMHGNVWEWCQDYYGPYDHLNYINPEGPTSGSGRVLRGGSWLHGPRYLRSAQRDYNGPEWRYSSIGFRLVRTSFSLPSNPCSLGNVARSEAGLITLTKEQFDKECALIWERLKENK